jgi:hypothetical protein
VRKERGIRPSTIGHRLSFMFSFSSMHKVPVHPTAIVPGLSRLSDPSFRMGGRHEPLLIPRAEELDDSPAHLGRAG